MKYAGINEDFEIAILLRRAQSFWQEWAEGFQTLDDLQSVNLTPEDELKVKKLLSGDAADDEEPIF